MILQVLESKDKIKICSNILGTTLTQYRKLAFQRMLKEDRESVLSLDKFSQFACIVDLVMLGQYTEIIKDRYFSLIDQGELNESLVEHFKHV